MGYEEGRNISYIPTMVVGGEVEDFSETAMRIQGLLLQKPDVVAAIGTQASVPVRSIIENAGIPMVFAGVSYPVQGALIEAFGKPTEKNRTGVSYAIPLKQRLEIIRKLFPDKSRFKKIGFVYSSQVLQDVTYVDDIKALGSLFGWEFVYIDFFDYAQNSPSCNLFIKKLKTENPDLIFGWYGFDKLTSEENNAAKIVNAYQKPIIAVTTTFLDKGAIAGILSDHAGLGFIQAKMIDRIFKGENAGNIPPVEPSDYLIELNLKKAKELGVIFEPDIIKAAHRVIE